MKDGWKHLHGVTEASQSLNISLREAGNGDGQICAITYKDLSAIVSDSPPCDPKTLRKDLLVRHLLAHQKTIEALMNCCAIIPIKFGSFAHTDQEVERMLTDGYSLFKFLLPWAREKTEFELAVSWDRERIFKILHAEEPQLQFLQKEIEGASGEDSLSKKIELGKAVHGALLRRRALFKEKILVQLEDAAESRCEHDPMDDLMILNAAFLLQKEREREFERRVGQLDQAFSGQAFFKLVGPLPLYSFNSLEIEWCDVDQIREGLSLLGLKGEITSAKLKAAYYAKAQSLHPDKMEGLSGSSLEFEKVAEAYRLLKKYHSFHGPLPEEGRIPLMEVRNGSNERMYM